MNVHTHKHGRYLASAALTAGGPKLEGVATPGEHFLGALKVLASVTGCRATTAGVPVVRVDLPQTNIPLVSRASSVLVHSVGIATGLGLGDTLALRLAPAGVLRTPGGDVLHALGSSTGTRVTTTGTVSTTGSAANSLIIGAGTDHGEEDRKQGKSNKQTLHFQDGTLNKLNK
jgi:hypothetical protein